MTGATFLLSDPLFRAGYADRYDNRFEWDARRSERDNAAYGLGWDFAASLIAAGEGRLVLQSRGFATADALEALTLWLRRAA